MGILDDTKDTIERQASHLFGGGNADQFVPVGLAMRFIVRVGQTQLGKWSACRGLQADFKPDMVSELGNPLYEKVLFPTIKYTPIVLERVMRKDDSQALQTWLRTQLRTWLMQPDKHLPEVAVITLLDSTGDPKNAVATWSLRNVYPSKWIGPTLSASKSEVAMETLELVHEGFL